MTDLLAGARAAVVGFGHQGAPQARLLRASGLEVVIGARRPGGSALRAAMDGFPVAPPEEAIAGADLIAVLIPDEAVPAAWPMLVAAAPPAATFVFAHGFNLLYAALTFPEASDVVLVSPAGPGGLLERGDALAAYLAVHQDASGRAWDKAEAYARRIGLSPTWRTTVREETEVDLFGEQAVLCGGMNAMVRTAFEVLVAHGYAPEIAYLECVHQLKHLADLLHERGIAGLRRAISGTALYGDLTRGERVFGAAGRQGMESILDDVRSGAFAAEWKAEVERGGAMLERAVRAAAAHPIEATRRKVLGEPEA